MDLWQILVLGVVRLGLDAAGDRMEDLTNREGERLDATDLLLLRRGQWGIEGKCHQRLDVSL